MQARETEPNGGIVAATIAAGAGCAALGLLTVGAAASTEFADLLTLYAPSGPLTGKATVAAIIYLIVWINLHFRLRDRELSLSRGFLLTMFLLAIGMVGTFPPVYQFFARVRTGWSRLRRRMIPFSDRRVRRSAKARVRLRLRIRIADRPDRLR